MNREQVQMAVEFQVKHWIHEQELQKRRIKLSDGARDVLVQMILNIDEDRSPVWHPTEKPSAAQERAVSLIPLALNHVVEPALLGAHRKARVILSSWELWHAMSGILDWLCFIPKFARPERRP